MQEFESSTRLVIFICRTILFVKFVYQAAQQRPAPLQFAKGRSVSVIEVASPIRVLHPSRVWRCAFLAYLIILFSRLHCLGWNRCTRVLKKKAMSGKTNLSTQAPAANDEIQQHADQFVPITAVATQDDKEPELPLSRAKSIALVATVTGAAFLNVRISCLSHKRRSGHTLTRNSDPFDPEPSHHIANDWKSS